MTEDERTPDTQVLIERANHWLEFGSPEVEGIELVAALRDALAAQKDAPVTAVPTDAEVERVAKAMYECRGMDGPGNHYWGDSGGPDRVTRDHWKRFAHAGIRAFLAKPESEMEKP